jgi:hypothetical protein
MLQIAERLSMDKTEIVSPQNSTAMYIAPFAFNRPIKDRITSLEKTPAGNFPDKSILSVSGTLNQSLPYVIATAKSVDPTPVEKALRAPYVHV